MGLNNVIFYNSWSIYIFKKHAACQITKTSLLWLLFVALDSLWPFLLFNYQLTSILLGANRLDTLLMLCLWLITLWSTWVAVHVIAAIKIHPLRSTFDASLTLLVRLFSLRMTATAHLYLTGKHRQLVRLPWIPVQIAQSLMLIPVMFTTCHLWWRTMIMCKFNHVHEILKIR